MHSEKVSFSLGLRSIKSESLTSAHTGFAPLPITFFLHSCHHSAPPPSLHSLSFQPFSFLNFLPLNLLPKNKLLCEHATGHASHRLVTDIWISSPLLWEQATPWSASLHKKPGDTCSPFSHMPESPRVTLNKGVSQVTFLKMRATLGQANEVVLFFKIHLPCPPKLR